MRTDRRSFLKLLGLGGLGLFLSSRQPELEPAPAPARAPEEQEVLDVLAETPVIAGTASSMWFTWEDAKL